MRRSAGTLIPCVETYLVDEQPGTVTRMGENGARLIATNMGFVGLLFDFLHDVGELVHALQPILPGRSVNAIS